MLYQAFFPRILSVLVVLPVLALAACDPMTAQPTVPTRPVLVTNAHFESQVSERSFVGTVRPRIESDLGFRVAGKVAKRLVEVGTLVEAGQPLALLDEADLSLQAEQAAAELSAANGVVAQATAAETRAKELRQKGWSTDAQMDQAKAAADEARARLNRAERSVDLTKNSLSYARLVADAAGVVTATLIEPGQVVSAGQTSIRVARLAEKEVVVAIPETLLARAKSGRRTGVYLVRTGQELRRKASRARAIGRSGDTDVPGEIFNSGCRRCSAVRNDGDVDFVRPRQRTGCTPSSLGIVQSRQRAFGFRRRRKYRRNYAETCLRQVIRTQ